MLTSTIDAQEACDVATVNIPEAFMQADMDEVVFRKLRLQCHNYCAKLTQNIRNSWWKESNVCIVKEGTVWYA
jgi:hypothetical protein